jgi:FkbM family methyltransferase
MSTKQTIYDLLQKQGLFLSQDILRDVRERLINVELKINALRGEPAAQLNTREYAGHPDQAFGRFTYSQHGEDMILVNVFELLGIPRPSYLDVGAHHPFNISNTALLNLRGSTGINVEANPNLIAAFMTQRPEDKNLNCGVGPASGSLDFYFIDDWSGRNTFDKLQAEAFVRQYPAFMIRQVQKIDVITLDQVIAEHAYGVWPDFFSIDVEGWDYAIIEASNMRSGKGPKVVCVEVVTAGNSDTTADLSSLLRSRGYHAYARTTGNVIFLDDASHRHLLA